MNGLSSKTKQSVPLRSPFVARQAARLVPNAIEDQSQSGLQISQAPSPSTSSDAIAYQSSRVAAPARTRRRVQQAPVPSDPVNAPIVAIGAAFVGAGLVFLLYKQFIAGRQGSDGAAKKNASAVAAGMVAASMPVAVALLGWKAVQFFEPWACTTCRGPLSLPNSSSKAPRLV